jgi:N-acetylneuraminic acid mutarotase
MKYIFVFFSLVSALTAQVWSPLPDFPGSKRDDGAAVVVGNKAYFGTGLQEGWSAIHNWYALDLTNYTWSKLPDMPSTKERQYACAFAGSNCFYVFGGDGVGGALNDLYKFDLVSNTWIQMNPKPGAGIVAANCFSFGDRIYIVAGKLTGPYMNKEVWEYTLSTNSWKQKNNLPFAGRWRASGTVLHNFGYLLFGIDSSDVFRKELYRYDANFDTWTKVSDFPMAKGRAYAAMENAAHKLFVFGGYDSTKTYYNDVWYYNDVLNTWSTSNALPSFGRKGGMFCAANDHFYYTCGIDKNDNRLNQTWMTDVPLSIRGNEPELNIKLFPVPVKDYLTLELEKLESYRVLITDLNGREMVEAFIDGSDSQINLSGLVEGVYVLKLYSGDNFIGCKKIIKAKE